MRTEERYPLERPELMNLYDSFMARPSPNDNAIITRHTRECRAQIIAESENPDVVKIWMRQYDIAGYLPGKDALEIRAAIRQQIVAGRLADDVFRIVIRPTGNDDRWQGVRSWYVDAPASSGLRDAIIAYDKLHGTDLLTLHELYPKTCRKGDGSEYTEPATPDHIRYWDEIMAGGSDPFAQYRSHLKEADE